MKKIYENFSEIAREFTDGERWAHRLSDHTREECMGWQHGVQEFAKWLDTSGAKLIENTEIWDMLWDELRAYKPEKEREDGERYEP